MRLERKEGWESRLVAVIERARGVPYVLGRHDCFSLACSAIEALTGVDLYADWRGRYSTRAEAVRLVAAYGGSFTGSFTRLFGVEPVLMKLARRGDIAELVDDEGEHHLGVVLNTDVAVMRETMDFLPRTMFAHAWRIG